MLSPQQPAGSSSDLTDSIPPLSQAERGEILRLARQAIGAALGVADAPELQLSTPDLLAPGAAFVSIYCAGQLRGCVGSLESDTPLHETVAAMARAAAQDDFRFAPLTAAEWPQIDIEISRLGPLRPARPEQVIPGQHGVYITRGAARGVLLPQVGARSGWTRERLLNETCHKAGLPSRAWRGADIELFVFAAEVLSDRELPPATTEPGR